MKLIVIEGGDRLGKNSLIKGLCEYFNYDNVTIRHFGKPPKRILLENVLDFQFQCFDHEANLVSQIRNYESSDRYYDETVIWNRSHLGEYTYSQLFRGANPDLVKIRLQEFEAYKLTNSNIYLITLTADPDFFFKKEDGNSFSQSMAEKAIELELFKEAHEFSLIKNKLLIKVDKDGEFRGKQEILDEVIEFIK